MPGKVKVKIIAGRNLPVMDRSNDTTDAYVELKLGATSYKSDVCKKSLNPRWNTDWFLFEVEDTELQEEPLQIRLMDYDTYSANDSIGKIYLDLNPFVLPRGAFLTKFGIPSESNNCENFTNTILSGWIPVYDTLQGIRGEININVKVELFSDSNRFRQSSCGVQFYCASRIPQGYYVKSFHGFVEELIVNDDPEYQWIDKIRTPRASNEARQFLLYKLYGELQRKIGVKTLELGGNAVIGYGHCFDLEGDFGIVARGIGTAVTLIRVKDATINADVTNEENFVSPLTELCRNYLGHQRTESVGGKSLQSPLKSNLFGISHRRSSDSDLSITPKGSSLTGSDQSYGHASIGFVPRFGALSRSGMHQENFDMLDYPFITMTMFPIGYIINFGGVVSARSVKRLDRFTSSDEPNLRGLWWNELRLEMRAHARSLNCNAVLAYAEYATVYEDICVLSAIGTAAVVGDINECNMCNSPNLIKSIFPQEYQRVSCTKPLSESPDSNPFSYNPTACSICHLPYSGTSSVLQSTTVNRCTICRIGKVSDVLISNTEMPDGMPTVGRGCFIQAYVCRQMKDSRNEPNAKEISDSLPFLEYELNRNLMNKIKIKGMNAIFGLKVRISINAKMLVGVATGTGVFLLPLKSLPVPVLVASQTADDKNIANMQNLLNDTVRLNKEIYQLKLVDYPNLQQSPPDQDIFEIVISSLNPTKENRDCSVLEVDDPEDMEIMSLVMEPRPPEGFHIVNTESVPGLEEIETVKRLQLFTHIMRAKVQHSYNFGKHINELLESVYFKLRYMIPCALCDLQFNIDLPEIDEMQLSVIGMALYLNDAPRILSSKTQLIENDEEDIFVLEEDFNENVAVGPSHVHQYKSRVKYPHGPQTNTNVELNAPDNEWHGVDITSLSYMPGGKVERYFGNLNLFFIRESTSVREDGGISGFMHRFVNEVIGIVRSHINALGGNALLSYYMTQCVISHSIHKNQGQCLINIGGDVVFVVYSNEE